MDRDLVGLNAIKLPVRVAALDGKYYGTKIVDADGNVVCRFWTAEGEPSAREKEVFGRAWTGEEWAKYVCDSHWECEDDLHIANWFVEVLNSAQTPSHAMVGGHKSVNRSAFSVREILEIGQESAPR